MSEEIVIEIGTSGDVRIEVNGVKGEGCKALTKGLEDALGTVEGLTLKPEHAIPAAPLRPRTVGR